VVELTGSILEFIGSVYSDLSMRPWYFTLFSDEAFKAKLLPQHELGSRIKILLLLRVVARRHVPIALVCS